MYNAPNQIGKMNNQGFTLIELVIVIIILGILAATAAPKYIDLRSDAHTAVLKAISGSMEGASALVYGKALVKGVHTFAATGAPSDKTVSVAGNDIVVHYGYPRGEDSDWGNLIEVDTAKYTLEETISGDIIVYPNEIYSGSGPTDLTDPCLVIYTPATSSVKAKTTINECE